MPCDDPQPINGLTSITCSTNEVEHLLKTMRPDVATGPDSVSSIMLRNTASTISSPLTAIFNQSLATGSVPSDWKRSNITPVYKKDDPALATNYRPISLLSLVSKVLERIIHNRLMRYLISNSYLSRFQFGFRPMGSTQEAILTATNDWHKTLDRGLSSAAVFFDLSKAFDTVPHHLLLQTLRSIGISGPLLEWFDSYLSNRQQRVVIRGHSSSYANVDSGVPQESILGPLLFIIYMNSIFDLRLSPDSKIILYADDILLYKPIKTPTDISDLQSNVDKIQAWVASHSLQLNISKTKAMLISHCKNKPQLHLHVNNSAIEVVDSLTYLGVTITSTLNWSSHIENTTKRARRQLGYIYRAFHHAGPATLTQLYKSTVLPLVDYCSSVWAPHHKKYIEEVESVQKFATRIVTKRWNDSYSSLISQLNWPTLEQRRNCQKLVLCYNIVKNLSFIPSSNFVSHPHPSLRHSHNLCLLYPLTRSNSHKFSFFVSVVPLWNSLPSPVVNASSLNSFKYCLKNSFFS